MSKCKALELDPILGQTRNRIKLLGVELEGGWDTVPPGVGLAHDSSVFKNMRVDNINYGELPIGPIQPAALPRFIKKYYPDHVNFTCGLHVHMSFENIKHYYWLMAQEFQVTMVSYLVKWATKEGFPDDHYIWKRLSGKVKFCQQRFMPDDQYQIKRKDYLPEAMVNRYTAVNYCGRLNTIEVRVLPMMDTAEQAIRGVREIIDITNASLLLLGEKEKPVVGKLEMSNGDVYEEYIEELL